VLGYNRMPRRASRVPSAVHDSHGFGSTIDPHFAPLCYQGIADTIVQLFDFHTFGLMSAFITNVADCEGSHKSRGKQREARDAGRGRK